MENIWRVKEAANGNPVLPDRVKYEDSHTTVSPKIQGLRL